METSNNTNKKASKKQMSFAVLTIAIVVVLFMTIMQLNSKGGEEKCEVVPQAAFGQSQSQAWSELEGSAAAAAIAKFSLDVPTDPIEGYDDVHYLVYTQQIYEIRYLDDNANEGLRIAKGKMCGKSVYDVNNDYQSRTIEQIGDVEVTLYGTEDTVSIATWVDGDYSYFIGAWDNPITKEQIESMIPQIQ